MLLSNQGFQTFLASFVYKCTFLRVGNHHYRSTCRSETERDSVSNNFNICFGMGYLCLQVVGLLLVGCCFGKKTTIHLFPGGVVSEEIIKTNLLNAYNRFFRARQAGVLSFYLDGVLVLDHIRLPSASIEDEIRGLNLRREKSGDCTNWYMDHLEADAGNYILSDLNPCNGTDIVTQAQTFLRTNRRTSFIVPIGMGNSIHSEWLKQTCGPCSAPLGCYRGWNWFRI